MEPVTTGQIYWGAVPFVIIQVIMVGLAIAFPQMIMHYKGTGTGVDPATIEINIPTTTAAAIQLRISARRATDFGPADADSPPAPDSRPAPPSSSNDAKNPEPCGSESLPDQLQRLGALLAPS